MDDLEIKMYLEYSRGYMDCFKSKSKYPDGTLMTPEDAFPEYEKGSMGFRMGPGQNYLIQWNEWFENLSDEERKNYKNNHMEK